MIRKPLNIPYGSHEIFVYENLLGYFAFPNALEWAFSVAYADSLLKGTVMRNAIEESEEEGMIYFSRGGASRGIREKMIESAKEGAAVQLQIDAVDKKAPEVKNFIDAYLRPGLEDRYPFGYAASPSLFITGGGHVYDAHNDVGDGFLVQLAGVKHMKCWGPSKEYWNAVIFDHDHIDHPEKFSGEVQEIELTPGQGVYFPRGTMHEISVPEGEVSVSLACPFFSVYNLVDLVGDLNVLAGDSAAYSLPETHTNWFKFKVKFIDPTKFRNHISSKVMPSELKGAIAQVIQPKSAAFNSALRRHLDLWWIQLAESGKYPNRGVFPEAPEDRREVLQAWEKERLEGNQK